MEIKFKKDSDVISTVHLDDVLNVENDVIISPNKLISLDRESNVCEIVITRGQAFYVECRLRIFIKNLDLNIISDLNMYLYA